MSASTIVIAKLLATSRVTDLVGTNIFGGRAPQNCTGPRIVVRLISEPDRQMLSGAGRYYRARVSVLCEASDADGGPSGAALVDMIGEAAKYALEDVVKESIDGYEMVDVMKEGSDVSFPLDDRDADVRILDFYCDYKGA